MILTVIYQISHRVVYEGIVCLLNAEGYLSLRVFCAWIAFYTDELVAVEEVFILENFIAVVAFETPHVPVQVVMHVTLDPGGIMKPLRVVCPERFCIKENIVDNISQLSVFKEIIQSLGLFAIPGVLEY